MVEMATVNKKKGRVKREDCSRTKHDSLFSHWKILVGPNDWYDYSYSKSGAQRYRTHNLPDNFPGLYELGVTKSHKGNKTRAHELDNVIVVYLGQADNVRTRLQHYGRTGSHLETGKWNPGFVVNGNETGKWNPGFVVKENEIGKWNPGFVAKGNETGKWNPVFVAKGNETGKWNPVFVAKGNETGKWNPGFGESGNEIPVKEGPGLFTEIFARGCSVVYRCAKMKSKLEAEKREEQLLDYFDYAWNQIHNGFCRRDEILLKLQKRASDQNLSIIKKLQNLKNILFFEKTPGVRIDRTLSLDRYLIPEVRKFGINRPQLVKTEKDVDLRKAPLDENICGIVLGFGDVCAKKPVEGRKRCEDHKGRRIVETKIERFVKDSGYECKTEEEIEGSICGASEFDGSICINAPVKGRKRCEFHKGRREGKKAIVSNC